MSTACCADTQDERVSYMKRSCTGIMPKLAHQTTMMNKKSRSPMRQERTHRSHLPANRVKARKALRAAAKGKTAPVNRANHRTLSADPTLGADKAPARTAQQQQTHSPAQSCASTPKEKIGRRKRKQEPAPASLRTSRSAGRTPHRTRPTPTATYRGLQPDGSKMAAGQRQDGTEVKSESLRPQR